MRKPPNAVDLSTAAGPPDASAGIIQKNAPPRAAVAAFAFGMALLVVVIGPPLLPGEFSGYRLLRWGEVLDLLTPLLLIPPAWLLFRYAGEGRPSTMAALAFVTTAAILIEGQGIHLAANAIHHLIDDSGDLAQLVYDLDEVISHYIWHAALIGLSVVIGVRAARSAGGRGTAGPLALTAVGAIAFGFTFFAMVVEGETAPLGVPAAVLLGGGGLLAFRSAVGRRPALAVFVVGYLLAAFLFALWAAMNGGELVPPCEVIGC